MSAFSSAGNKLPWTRDKKCDTLSVKVLIGISLNKRRVTYYSTEISIVTLRFPLICNYLFYLSTFSKGGIGVSDPRVGFRFVLPES